MEIGLRFLVIDCSLHFFSLKAKPEAADHEERLWRSCCRAAPSPGTSLPYKPLCRRRNCTHYKHRQRVTVLGATSRDFPVTSGVPQGSILGPALFPIYVNNLPEVITKSHVVTRWRRSRRYAWSQSSSFPPKPATRNLQMNRSCLTLPKALDMSKYTQST